MKILQLALILALVLTAGCTGSGSKEACVADDNSLTKTEETELASNTFNYIRQVYLTPQNLDGEVGSIEKFAEVYVVNFTFGGDGMPATDTQAYITTDGRLLLLQGIQDISEIPETHVPTETETQPTEQTRMTVSIDDDYCLGSEDAPVTIIEFSDYQCPYCQNFWQQTLPQIKSEYIDNDLVKFVYRDFPLGFHANAQKAAEATECAGDEGKFWDMHYKIFGTLNEWSGVADPTELFNGYATELELDGDAFAECLDSGKYTEEVQADLAAGSAAGVSGTPAFFVNGVFVTGAQSFDYFKGLIDAEIADGGASSTITGNCTGKI
jgi:protein-disulfide isomerase